MFKKENHHLRWTLGLLLLSLVYLLFMAFFHMNYEFIFYGILYILVGGFLFIYYFDEFHFTKSVLFGLAILLILHSLGSTKFGGVQLYDMWIIPGILRFDNFLHFLGSFVLAFFAYNWLSPSLDQKFKNNKLFLLIFIVLIVSGFGAFNEIGELTAVVFFHNNGVGDYMNNALDLLFNFLGALVAGLYIILRNKK